MQVPRGLRPSAREGSPRTSLGSVARRGLTVVVFAAAGLMMVTSAQESAGTDLRPGRYDDLADLARQEGDRLTERRQEIQAITEEIADLRAHSGSADLRRVQEQGRPLRIAAGLEEMTGPGLTVTLDDAPEEVLASAGD